MQDNSCDRNQPFRFNIVEEPNGERYLVRTQEDFDLDLAAGFDGEETLRPGKYRIEARPEWGNPKGVTVSIQLKIDLDLLNHLRSQLEGDSTIEDLICSKLRLLMEIESGALQAVADEKKAA